jgi:hypothetical protein
LFWQVWQMSQVLSQTPVPGLHNWHGPHAFGAHTPVVGLHASHRFGHGFGLHTPVALSQVWQRLHFATHCPFWQRWHLVQVGTHNPLSGLQVWHGGQVFARQVPFTHVWHLVQVLTHCPLPLQVWHGPHLLLQTPFTHVWHCAVVQQLAPQVVCPTAQAEQTPLTQLPLEQSLPCVHCAPGLSVPGRKQALRRSVPAA